MNLTRLGGLLLAAALFFAACGDDGTTTDAAATTDDDAMSEDSMSEESMEDESMDDESMDDESMEDESMDDESMDDESMEDESMDDESMEDESMEDDEMMDDDMMGEATSFVVTIANTSADAETPTPLAPGVAFAYHGPNPLPEGMYHQAFESLAEDGDPSGFADIDGAVVFNTPDGASEAGPAGPGDAYSFTVEAGPGDALTFATMFAQSNDWIFTVEDFALFDADGNPVEGDITDAVHLVDPGLEADETPGEGPNQAPRQAGPNTGDPDPDPTARPVADRDVGDYVTVTITTG